MADILSNLYLAYSVEFTHQNDRISELLRKYCVDRLVRENNVIINRVIDNYPGKIKYLLKLIQTPNSSYDYNFNRDLIKELEDNKKIMETIRKGIYIDQPIINTLDKLDGLEWGTAEYRKNYDKLINVGEFNNN